MDDAIFLGATERIPLNVDPILWSTATRRSSTSSLALPRRNNDRFWGLCARVAGYIISLRCRQWRDVAPTGLLSTQRDLFEALAATTLSYCGSKDS